jgi:hypothetical protein
MFEVGSTGCSAASGPTGAAVARDALSTALAVVCAKSFSSLSSTFVR